MAFVEVQGTQQLLLLLSHKYGKFVLRVVSGIVPAIFFSKICSYIFMIFEVKLE